MKLRLPLGLRKFIFSSFLFAGIALASHSYARTITWNPTNPNYQNIDSASWLDENDQETTFQDGDDLIFSAHNGDDFRLAADITPGNIRFESGTSGKKNYWLSNTGGGHFLGSSTITVAMNNTTSDDVFVISGGLFKQFTGHFVVESCTRFQIGTNSGSYVVDENGVISIGETITANDGVTLRFELADSASTAISRSFETKIILNGNTSFDTYDRFGFTIGNNGGGLAINGTATWLGNQSGNAGVRLTVAGELTGGPDSVFILNGPTVATAGSVNITNLTRDNSYSGTLQVNANEGASANELHLSHGNAAQFATIQLNGGGAGSSTFDKAGLAVLSINTASATIAGLSGNANSLITSSAAAALKVNNATNSTYDGTITGGVSLVKIGAGDLTLTNAGNTHAGTVVQQGTLKLGSTASAGSSLTINGGATAEMLNGGTYSLDSGRTLNIASAGSSANLTGNLNFGGGTLTLDTAWLTSVDNADPYFIINGDVTFTADTTTTLSFSGDISSLTLGSYLFATANNIANFDISAWNFFTSPDLNYSYTLTTDGTNLWLEVKEREDLLFIWTGTGVSGREGDGVWTVNDGAGWKNGTAFENGKDVLFETLSGIGDATITIDGMVSPKSIVVKGDTNYTFDGNGAITGSGGLTIKDGGTLTMDGSLDNSGWDGTIAVENGELIFSTLDSLGTGNITLAGGTILNWLNASDNDTGASLEGRLSWSDFATLNLTVEDELTLWSGTTAAAAATINKYGEGTLRLTKDNQLFSNSTVNVGEGILSFETTGLKALSVASVTGNGTVLLESGFDLNEAQSVAFGQIFTDFTGTMEVASGTMSLYLNNNFTLGNQDLTIRVQENATFKIRLTNARCDATYSNARKIDNNLLFANGAILCVADGFTDFTGDMTFGDQAGDVVSLIATWDKGMRFSGKLSGHGDIYAQLDNGNAVVPVIISSENNDYDGTIYVGQKASGGDSAKSVTLRLEADAISKAKVYLQGNGKGILDLATASATIAGLNGATGSKVTSSVSSTLTVNNNEDNSYNGTIENGSGLALAKTGTGSLTLGNANTYAGGTTITQGKLIANNATALGNGDVLINGGTLQLSVPLVLQGSLTMASGNIVFDMSGPSGGGPVGGEAGPLGGAGLGSPVTVMTMTDFNMTGGSYTFKVFADGSYQSFASSTNGTFTMLNGSLTIDMSDYADFDGSSFSIDTFFQNFNNFHIDYQNVVSLIDASGWTHTIGADGMVTFSVIPEPSTAALFALAAAGLFGRRNRKVEA